MLAEPLDELWREAIDAVLAARGWPGLADAGRLGPIVQRLSQSYNEGRGAGRDLLPARLAFSFARDVPKGGAAVRELVAEGLLAPPLRVLDLGAGLGAMTWGVARALEAAGHQGELDATWVDTDAAALDVARDLLRARSRLGAPRVTVRAQIERGGIGPRPGPFDLVLVGQVLSELDPDVEKHAALLRALLGVLAPNGSLVVVEPALKDRTRHLHAVRDAIAAEATIFAPCLHADPCPALAHAGDWCHEDLPVDLPPFLTPIARAAGLRWQGLTFSYLVLRRDGKTLSGAWRVVSHAIVSKGKRELFLCGKPGPDVSAARLRTQRLDRHASPANAAFGDLARGDRVSFAPPFEAGTLGRVGAETRVDVARHRE
jgi:SAM-dependent methyltransferase